MASREKTFLVIPERVCRRADLTPIEKLVLGRVMSFDIYSESTEQCAEMLGVCKGSVTNSKRSLEQRKFIECVDNDGRGKAYITSSHWPLDGKQVEEPEEPKKETRGNLSILRPSTSTKKTPNEWNNWKKKNADLVPILDLATNYLAKQKIPITDPKALRRSLLVVANMYRSEEEPTAHIYLLRTYFDYLESDDYAYQLEHTKYCPIISSQNDLFGKFQAIRDFKNDPRRHYDPTKTLTR